MPTMPGTPTMPPNEPNGRYVLSINPTRARPARDGIERLERILNRPVWTQADRDRLVRARDGLWEHWNQAIEGLKMWEKYACPDDCRECAMIGRIDPLVAEWDKINGTPIPPTTAQLRNALRRPDRTVRAARLYRDLAERTADRWRQVILTVKPYKTVSVRLRHEKNATDADPALRRLERAMARLKRYVPDAEYLGRTVR